MHDSYTNNNNRYNYLSDHSNPIFATNSNQDASKLIESLRARLGFARFKIKNGWGNNSFGDIESFWKQKQRQSIKEIPVPRFTQQDIIDKRSHIPAASLKQTKYRRPRHPIPYKIPGSEKHKLEDGSIVKGIQQQKKKKEPTNTASASASPPATIEQQQHHDLCNKGALRDEPHTASTPTSSCKTYSLPSSQDSQLSTSDFESEPVVIRSSLDYLSYAIEMTENERSPYHKNYRRDSGNSLREPTLLEDSGEEDEDTDHLRDDASPDWTRTSQLRLSLSIPNQPADDKRDSTPLSATDMAAHTMLMFVNKEQSYHKSRSSSPVV